VVHHLETDPADVPPMTGFPFHIPSVTVRRTLPGRFLDDDVREALERVDRRWESGAGAGRGRPGPAAASITSSSTASLRIVRRAASREDQLHGGDLPTSRYARSRRRGP